MQTLSANQLDKKSVQDARARTIASDDARPLQKRAYLECEKQSKLAQQRHDAHRHCAFVQTIQSQTPQALPERFLCPAHIVVALALLGALLRRMVIGVARHLKAGKGAVEVHDNTRNNTSERHQMNLMRQIILGMLFLIGSAHADLPSPTPIPKDGSCPSGYGGQGNFCVPSSGAKFAIAKSGSCPSGYGSQGSYCVADSSAKLAMLKGSGSCPSGYGAQGNYCVSSR